MPSQEALGEAQRKDPELDEMIRYIQYREIKKRTFW